MSMMERYVGAKPNVFYFQTEKGVFAIGADDPNAVVDAPWFREFLGLRRVLAPQVKELPEELPELPVPKPPAKMAALAPAPAKQDVFADEIFVEKAKPKMIDPMEINPDQMDERLWAAMDNPQRIAWRKKWLGQ